MHPDLAISSGDAKPCRCACSWVINSDHSPQMVQVPECQRLGLLFGRMVSGLLRLLSASIRPNNSLLTSCRVLYLCNYHRPFDLSTDLCTLLACFPHTALTGQALQCAPLFWQNFFTVSPLLFLANPSPPFAIIALGEVPIAAVSIFAPLQDYMLAGIAVTG